MQPQTPVDYIGTSAAVALSTILPVTMCKWFQVVGVSIGSIAARVGDSAVRLDVTSPVTHGRGIPITSGGSQFSPPIASEMAFYDLTTWYVVVATGDTVSVACAL